MISFVVVKVTSTVRTSLMLAPTGDIIGFYCYLNPVKVKITGEAVAGIYSKQLSWDFLLWDIHYETNKFLYNFKENKAIWER